MRFILSLPTINLGYERDLYFPYINYNKLSLELVNKYTDGNLAELPMQKSAEEMEDLWYTACNNNWNFFRSEASNDRKRKKHGDQSDKYPSLRRIQVTLFSKHLAISKKQGLSANLKTKSCSKKALFYIGGGGFVASYAAA